MNLLQSAECVQEHHSDEKAEAGSGTGGERGKASGTVTVWENQSNLQWSWPSVGNSYGIKILLESVGGWLLIEHSSVFFTQAALCRRKLVLIPGFHVSQACGAGHALCLLSDADNNQTQLHDRRRGRHISYTTAH
ncbi:hypothetical protein M758_9G073400 [Ceratodon purpureus]|nr:hypothetical protein M758_9G073400 [Ceratodon purpureus]